MLSALNVFTSLTLTTALWCGYHYYHTILHMEELKPENGHFLKVTQLVCLRTGLVHSISLIYLTITFTCSISWDEYFMRHSLVNVGVERTKWGELRKVRGHFSIVGEWHSHNSKDRIHPHEESDFLARNKHLKSLLIMREIEIRTWITKFKYIYLIIYVELCFMSTYNI